MSRRKEEETRPCSGCGSGIPLSKTQCPSCKRMDVDDSMEEPGKDGIIRFSELGEAEYPNRIMTGPWDKNFGTHYDNDGTAFSGIANTTVTLIGGKNGSGKSTLAMQVIRELIESTNVKSNPKCTKHPNCHRRDALYISAEEGNNALRSRAKRLGYDEVTLYHLLLSPLGSRIPNFDGALERYKPIGMVGDSISKMVPDIDKAVDFCDNLRLRCEQHKMPAILINHINKEGDQAGMEALQHSVDAVLLFTIDTDKIRIIETIKNRNGEDGVKTLYKMTGKGLVHRPDLEDELNEEEDEDGEEEEEEEYDDE